MKQMIKKEALQVALECMEFASHDFTDDKMIAKVAEAKEVLMRMQEQLSKPKTSKPSKKDIEAAHEREEIAAKVLEILEDGEPHFAGVIAEMLEISSAKLAASIKGLTIEKGKIKGKTVYKMKV